MTIETFHLAPAILQYHRGWTLADIATDQHCGRTAVRVRLLEAGVKMRQKGRKPPIVASKRTVKS